MTAKTDTTEVSAPRAGRAAAYVAGSHTAGILAEHDAKRTELLARDEVLAAEIDVRQNERHDINDALGLMSQPGVATTNVVAMAAE